LIVSDYPHRQIMAKLFFTKIVLALFVGLLPFPVCVLAQTTFTYRVEYSTSRPGLLHVSIIPSKPITTVVTLVIPRAITGGYGQQFYDRYVENVNATTATGVAAKVVREDGPRWRLGEGIARVEYDVDLTKLEREITSASDSSKARPNYVGVLGYSALGYFDGFENLPIRLEIPAPEGWPVFTTLAPKAPLDKTQTIAEAKNFYELADSQIALGTAVQIRRLESSIPLFLVSYFEAESDLNKHSEIFVDAFRKVLNYFGEAPFTHYTAYIEILKPLSDQHQYGFSMEHLNSSTYFLGVDRAISSTITSQQIETERFNFAHHVAHSWIPKQVYGTGYLPFTWELAPQIDTIWFNEGFARYITVEALADALPENQARQFRERRRQALVNLIAGMPEFLRTMPLTELSRIGSMMYSGDFRTGRTLFSKGALMAEEMDLYIREQTRGKKRLRDSMRALVKWGQQSKRPFRIDELPGLIAKPVGVNERDIAAIMNKWLAAGK
jgi:predicted metalloprotease with PDZ domain